MRPLQLTMSAWGPYKDVVSIDFSKFQEGSVFLITGPTGAGKTTIFDGISYALFGGMSGSNRDKTSVRSDFASIDTDTFVDFRFRHKNQIYHIVRKPKYDRPKMRGEGFTTSNETAVLEFENAPPITAVTEVNRKMEEIMGINYEQFKQIAMIAQGEFLSLLYAKSEAKVDIFRNLFKTKLYDDILRNLTDQAKKLAVKMKEQKNKMDEAISSIDATGNAQLSEKVDTENPNYEKITELLKIHIKSLEMKAKQYKKDMEAFETIQEQQMKDINIGKELNRNIETSEKLQREFAQLEEQKDDISQKESLISLANRAQKVSIHEKLYQDSLMSVNDWSQKIQAVESEIEDAKNKLNQLQEELKQFAKMEEEIEKHQEQIHYLENLLPLVQKLLEHETSLAKISSEFDFYEKSENISVKELENEKLKRQNLKEELKRFEGLETKLGDINVSIQEAKQLYDSYRRARIVLAEINEGMSQLKQMQDKYKVCEETMKKSKANYEEKEQIYRMAAVGLVARFLVEGSPCPVCGSIDHPKKASISHDVPDEKQLDEYKKQYEKDLESYNAIYHQASTLKGTLDAKKEDYNRVTQGLNIGDANELMKAYEEITRKSKELLAQREQLLKLQLEKEEKNKAYESCEAKVAALEEKVLKIRSLKQAVMSEKDTLKGSVELMKQQLPKEFQSKAAINAELSLHKNKVVQLKNDMDEMNQRKELLSSLYESKKTLRISYQEEHKQAIHKMERRKKEFLKALSESEFLDISEYEHAKLSEERIKTLDLEMKQYHEAVSGKRIELQHMEQLIAGKERVDVEILEAKLEEVMSKKRELQELRETVATRIICNKRAYESLKEKQEIVSTLEEKYGYVSDLEKVAKGNNSHRLVFEHYVLAAYFEDILGAANQRLNAMTNSRYELLRVEKVADARTKDSLDLEVYDHYTGKRRSVKTLSGGESFKAALSLALGLSDIIQQNAGGIEIDTLFIDEGFGSLDSESLDQALKTLTTLTGSNKLIGIISHVSELKERVDNQIVVEKDHYGSWLA